MKIFLLRDTFPLGIKRAKPVPGILICYIIIL